MYLSCVSAAAVPACLRGSFPSGGSHLPLPPLQSRDPLHLLPGRLHHPPLYEPTHLRFSGWAVQEVLDPVPGLSGQKYCQGQTGVTASEPACEIITSIRLHVSSWFSSAQFNIPEWVIAFAIISGHVTCECKAVCRGSINWAPSAVPAPVVQWPQAWQNLTLRKL